MLPTRKTFSHTLAFGNLLLEADTYVHILAALDGRGGDPGGSLTINAGADVQFEANVFTKNGDVIVSAGTGSIRSMTADPTAMSFTESSGHTLIATGSGYITLGAFLDDATVRIVSPLLLTSGKVTIRGYFVDLDNGFVSKGQPRTLSRGSLVEIGNQNEVGKSVVTLSNLWTYSLVYEEFPYTNKVVVKRELVAEDDFRDSLGEEPPVTPQPPPAALLDVALLPDPTYEWTEASPPELPGPRNGNGDGSGGDTNASKVV